MEIIEELKANALACETAEELLELAAENGIELTAEEAEFVLEDTAETREGELADEELEDVAGGKSPCSEPDRRDVVYFRTAEEVQYIFNVGDSAELFTGRKSHTVNVKITGRKAQVRGYARYRDEYYVEESGRPAGRFSRWHFEK